MPATPGRVVQAAAKIERPAALVLVLLVTLDVGLAMLGVTERRILSDEIITALLSAAAAVGVPTFRERTLAIQAESQRALETSADRGGT